MAIKHGKLTKTFLMGLRQFDFIASGVQASPGVPVYSDFVSAPEARAGQWNAIAKCKAAQRNCFVFVNKQQYLNFLQQFTPVEKT